MIIFLLSSNVCETKIGLFLSSGEPCYKNLNLFRMNSGRLTIFERLQNLLAFFHFYLAKHKLKYNNRARK